MKIFVYGSLTKPHWNNSMLDGCPYLGAYKTAPTFDLMEDAALPYLKPTGDYAVWGEVYEVNEATLEMLDWMEGHPTWYKRVPVPLQGYATTVEGYTYPHSIEGSQRAFLEPDGALKWRPA